MDQLTAYKILGVPPGSSPEEIRKAYMEKAVLLHPEVHPNEFAQLQEAWSLLKKGSQKLPNGFHGIFVTKNEKNIFGQRKDLSDPEKTDDGLGTLFEKVDQSQEQGDQEKEEKLAEIERIYGSKKRRLYQNLCAFLSVPEAEAVVRNLIKNPQKNYRQIRRKYLNSLKPKHSPETEDYWESWTSPQNSSVNEVLLEDLNELLDIEPPSREVRKPIPVWAGILIAFGWLLEFPLWRLVPKKEMLILDIFFGALLVLSIVLFVMLYRRMCYNSPRVEAKIRVGGLMMLYPLPAGMTDNIRSYYNWYCYLAVLGYLVGFLILLINVHRWHERKSMREVLR